MCPHTRDFAGLAGGQHQAKGFVLPLYSPLGPLLVSHYKEGVGAAGMIPLRGCGGGLGLEHTALEEKLREWDLFRSEQRP